MLAKESRGWTKAGQKLAVRCAYLTTHFINFHSHVTSPLLFYCSSILANPEPEDDGAGQT